MRERISLTKKVKKEGRRKGERQICSARKTPSESRAETGEAHGP